MGIGAKQKVVLICHVNIKKGKNEWYIFLKKKSLNRIPWGIAASLHFKKKLLQILEKILKSHAYEGKKLHSCQFGNQNDFFIVHCMQCSKYGKKN